MRIACWKIKIDHVDAFSDIFHSFGFIEMATSKLRSIKFHQLLRKIIFYSKNSYKTSVTFQLFQLADAMGLEDESCMDKVKEMYP